MSSFTPAHSPFEEQGPDFADVREAIALASRGQRLDRAAAEALYYKASLHSLAQLAHSMRLRMHPDPIVTYVGDRNINYSNVCVCACRFCAFFRAPDHEDCYVISREEMARKVEETLDLGGTQILLQGGHHPDLPLEWYEDLLRWLRQSWPQLHIHAFSPPEIFFWAEKFNLLVPEVLRRLKKAGLHSLPGGGTQILLQGGHHPDLPLEWYEDLLRWLRETWPQLHIHAFSPPEIFFWAEKFNLSVPEVLRRLKEAGLHSLPGGGAEILHTGVRAQVSPNKCTAEQWLGVMEEAHKLGLRTTATMMFGHEESPAHRLDHLFAVREVQDRTHGFTAFIPWTFQPAHTRIQVAPLPAPAYLRLLAVSRLVLDNVTNIQASWVTMGPHVAQLALFYGANDFGSLMIEENVVAAAGVSFQMSRADIHKVISAAGFTPIQRTMDYRPVDPQPKV